MKNKDKEQMKSIGVGIVVLLVIAIFFVSIYYISYNSTPSKSNSGSSSSFSSSSKSSCKTVQQPYQEQEPYSKTEYYMETVPYTDTVCETKKLVYAIDVSPLYVDCLNTKEACDDSFLGINYNCEPYCADKKWELFTDVKNLDSETGGNWKFKGVCEVNGQILTDTDSVYVYPQSTKSITSTFRIQSDGVSGTANQRASCYMMTESIPTKQVCKDVTKYKEVQRSKQVTAYRSVTKYRTIEDC